MRPTQSLVLQLGLAFVFIAFGIEKVLDPAAWQSYVPQWIPLPVIPFLYLIGVVEVVLGVLVLLQKTSRIAAVGCAALLLGIIPTLGWNEITIRDIGLLAMAVALALQPAPGAYVPAGLIPKRFRPKTQT